jgi:YbbR domain-containing protein
MTTAACLSFLLVSGAWFGFTRSSDTLVSFDVPIQYAGRAQGVDIVDASDDEVKVKLMGAGTLLKTVRSEKLSVMVDLSNLPLGSNMIRLSPETVSSPPGVEVNQITPAEIEVVLDKYVRREIPVQIDWKGKLPADLLLTEAFVEPAVLDVSGRSLLLEELGTLYTEPLLLDRIEKSGVAFVPVLIPENVKPSSGSNNRVTVTYKIVKRGDSQ